MKLYTTIEINETDTEVIVDFEIQHGEAVILKMTDVHTGDAIAPDLLSELHDNMLYNEMLEYAADIRANKVGRFNHA